MTTLPEVILDDQSVVPAAVTTVTLATTPLRKEPSNLESLIYGLKPTPPSEPRPTRDKEGSAKGKREAAGPIVTTSDEDEPSTPPESPREPRDIPLSPTFHDHDYENISSPGGSSTASGPIYVRPPGFTHHAHSVAKPKVKKKKTNTALVAIHDSNINKEPLPPKAKPKREPLPMRMRALPQSFWQQPNNAHNASPAQNYSILPPLVARDGEDVPDIRPVSPTHEESEKVTKLKHDKSSKVSERKLTTANTDLLFKLFDNIEKDTTKVPSTRLFNTNHASLVKCEPCHRESSVIPVRRGRPRKLTMGTVSTKNLLCGDDPYLVDCVTEQLFPQLNLEQSKAMLNNGGSVLQVVTIREGDKCVSLPSLSVEHNYPQMLSELVMHI